MKFDVFFSIAQVPVNGHTPTDARMFANFFDQVEAADALGFGTAWMAESHLSSEIQKRNARPVIPHWEGEVGLMADFPQLAHKVFARTRRIEVGSAVTNILTAGGPIAAAERIATFCTLHGLDPEEKRRLNVGFAGGRFEYMNRPYGIVPRDAAEELAWPIVKGQIFWEAAEIFCRLLRGDVLCSDDIRPTVLTRAHFRDDAEWSRFREAAGAAGDAGDEVQLPRRYAFEHLKIVPQDWRRDLLQLVAGTHDPLVQVDLNRILPVQVFNLSITQPALIEATHVRMREAYHRSGGPWQRSYMPRTTFVFLNAQPGLSPARQRAAAREEAEAALGAYWKALEGTLDPAKVANAADNALVGNPGDVAEQARERFHPDDRLMLWFDFFNHDSARVVANMEAFVAEVIPALG